MEDGLEAADESPGGDGKQKQVTITDKTQAGNMKGYFQILPPGTRAEAAPPPPGHAGALENTHCGRRTRQ